MRKKPAKRLMKRQERKKQEYERRKDERGRRKRRREQSRKSERKLSKSKNMRALKQCYYQTQIQETVLVELRKRYVEPILSFGQNNKHSRGEESQKVKIRIHNLTKVKYKSHQPQKRRWKKKSKKKRDRKEWRSKKMSDCQGQR